MGGIATDVAGEVVEVGPEVKNLKAGDKVVAFLNPLVSITIVLLLSSKCFCSASCVGLFDWNCLYGYYHFGGKLTAD